MNFEDIVRVSGMLAVIWLVTLNWLLGVRAGLDVMILYMAAQCEISALDIPVRPTWMHGLVYDRLRALEDVGLIESREVPGGPERGGRPKRLYRLKLVPRDET